MTENVVHILKNSVDTHPDNNALMYKKAGEYTAITYQQFWKEIKNIAGGLKAAGINSGDKISILSYNRPEWTISDFATFAVHGVVVPLYQTLPANQIAYILNDAKVRAIFVEDDFQYRKILEIKNECPALEFIFSYSEIESNKKDLFTYSDLLSLGEKYITDNPDFFHDSIDAIAPEEVCSMVYTSGTTGEPKGVMLHHQGFVADIIGSESVIGLRSDDIFLSFLPLSHLYERLAGHWCCFYRGGCVGYADSIETVIEDIQKVRPTVMVSVPRLFEKISSAVIEQVEASPAIRQKIFYWAVKTGKLFHEKKLENNVSSALQFKFNLADKLVFSKIKAKMGGRLRFPISGGAPISTETLKFFESMDIQIIEGYGMTETHLIISLTPAGKTRYGSCGKPIPGVEVKIGEDDEILVRGKTLMSGYFNKPEATADAIDSDGWLHTGDIGHMDTDQFIYITDRKKNIIVTAGGKNIAPAPVELAIQKSKYIDDICLIGNQRKFISALIVPNLENLKIFAESRNVEMSENNAWLHSDAVISLIQEEIESHQLNFARYEKVKKFKILETPLSIENGELTPSLKIKRNIVEKKYSALIDTMYSE